MNEDIVVNSYFGSYQPECEVTNITKITAYANGQTALETGV